MGLSSGSARSPGPNAHGHAQGFSSNFAAVDSSRNSLDVIRLSAAAFMVISLSVLARRASSVLAGPAPPGPSRRDRDVTSDSETRTALAAIRSTPLTRDSSLSDVNA